MRFVNEGDREGWRKKAGVIVLENEGHGAGRVLFSDPKFVMWLSDQVKK
ncbi:MAG: hypothetical protein ACI9NQ_000321 [Paracoccaceae bacterium]